MRIKNIKFFFDSIKNGRNDVSGYVFDRFAGLVEEENF